MRNDRDTIRSWLNDALDRAGRGAKKRLAEYVGIRPEALSRMLGDEGEPRDITGLELLRASEFLGVPLPKLGNGREPMPTMVPLVSWVSAGRLTDSDAPTPQAESLIPMPDLAPGDYIALTVKGDSMDRISPENSVIVVNRGDRQLVSGRAYVFSIRGEATYKLWRPGPPPRLEPFSTNPMNEPIYPDRKRKLFVVGRVRRTLLDL